MKKTHPTPPRREPGMAWSLEELPLGGWHYRATFQFGDGGTASFERRLSAAEVLASWAGDLDDYVDVLHDMARAEFRRLADAADP